jgi:PKD repeat protein
MKNLVCFLLAMTTLSLTAQNTCTVKIVAAKNNVTPISYTFKTDPQTAGAKYLWSFSDGGVSDSPTPVHAFAKADTYLVTVKITGTDGKICTGELKTAFEATVVAPVVTYTGKGKVTKLTSATGCGLLISMDNGSVLVPIEMAIAFEFKDGQYVELAYELLKDKPSGCASGVSAKITKIADITPVTPCTVKIVASRNTPLPISYTFKTDPQTAGAKYLWSFSDGGVSDSPTPVHAFAKADTYLVTVKVTGTDGKICTGELKTTFEATPTTATTVTYTARGKVTSLASVTGCGLVISLDNVTSLIPAKMMTDFKLKEGQYVEFTYEKFAEKITTCKEGQDVKIITIKEIISTLPVCKGPISLLLYDPTDNKCNGSATVKLLDENSKEIANVKYLWSDGRTGSSAGSLCPDKLYTVQATVENACQKNTSFTLLSKPVWHTSSLNGINNFTVLAPSKDVQYIWNFGNGITMSGASVNYTFPQEGVYDVQLKALSVNGTSELTQQVVVSKSLAQAAVLNTTELQLYPNPVREILRVDFKNTDAKELIIQIKNMSGQVVYLNQITNDGSSHTDLNIQNLKAGIYMLRIYNGQLLIGERKFIKAD